LPSWMRLVASGAIMAGQDRLERESEPPMRSQPDLTWFCQGRNVWSFAAVHGHRLRGALVS
jgi:hypothetical protein